MKIDNSKQYSRPDEKCPRCVTNLNVRTVFHNLPQNCEKFISFPYMEIGESMHMECYIHHVMDKYLEKKMENSFQLAPKEMNISVADAPSKIVFCLDAEGWVMEISEEYGVRFNLEKYPELNPDDFALKVIQILERCFKVKFEKKIPPYDR